MNDLTLLEQRTIFRQGNHISPYFTAIIFNVLKQILAISFICWVKTYLDFIGIKEINLFEVSVKNAEITAN